MRFIPSYLRLYKTGELFRRISSLNDILMDCVMCPRRCHVNRLRSQTGVCGVADLPAVSSAQPHFGEEPLLVGTGGSGTIFMTNCNMRCSYCQNFEISQEGAGDQCTHEELALMMIRLMRQGCHNINFVTPTHQAAQIVESLPKAVEYGLELPLVYNCGGYEEAETIKLLKDIFDIYMPDLKYGDDETAVRLSLAHGYVGTSQAAVKEMHRQVGDLRVVDGFAVKGLIVRHLVLPGGLAGTKEVMRFIAEEISKDTYVNIMDQYRPAYNADKDPELSRKVTKEEYDEAVEIAKKAGLRRIVGVNVNE